MAIASSGRETDNIGPPIIANSFVLEFCSPSGDMSHQPAHQPDQGRVASPDLSGRLLAPNSKPDDNPDPNRNFVPMPDLTLLLAGLAAYAAIVAAVGRRAAIPLDRRGPRSRRAGAARLAG